jgi:hypothetical protein
LWVYAATIGRRLNRAKGVDRIMAGVGTWNGAASELNGAVLTSDG